MVQAQVDKLKPSFLWKYCWSEDDDFYFQKIYVVWDKQGVNLYSIEHVSVLFELLAIKGLSQDWIWIYDFYLKTFINLNGLYQNFRLNMNPSYFGMIYKHWIFNLLTKIISSIILFYNALLFTLLCRESGFGNWLGVKSFALNNFKSTTSDLLSTPFMAKRSTLVSSLTIIAIWWQVCPKYWIIITTKVAK